MRTPYFSLFREQCGPEEELTNYEMTVKLRNIFEVRAQVSLEMVATMMRIPLFVEESCPSSIRGILTNMKEEIYGH